MPPPISARGRASARSELIEERKASFYEDGTSLEGKACNMDFTLVNCKGEIGECFYTWQVDLFKVI
jgi:hypothetical protein